MDRLQLLLFITERTNDPAGAVNVAKEWDNFISGDKKEAVIIPIVEVKQVEEKPIVLEERVSIQKVFNDNGRYSIPFKRTLKKDIYPETGTKWSRGSLEKALAGLMFGLTYEEIGRQIGRSWKAVRDKHAAGEIPGAPKYDPKTQAFNKLGKTEKQLERATRNLL